MSQTLVQINKNFERTFVKIKNIFLSITYICETDGTTIYVSVDIHM